MIIVKTNLRKKIKNLSPYFVSGLTVFGAHARNFVEKASSESPNLIYIISDQLRFDAMSCMGNKIISTPNMDRLAAEGVIFTRAYSQSPVSTPSRASMLTGNSLCNTGIWSNSYATEVGTASLLTGKEPIYFTKTYDEVLAGNGYVCEYYGKWHIPEHKAYIYANRPITFASGPTDPVLGVNLKTNYMNWWKAELKISTAPTQQGALSGAPGGLNYMPDALDARVIDPTLTSTVDYQNFGRILIDSAHTEPSMDVAHTIDAIERNKSKKFSIHCSFGPPHPPFVVAAPYYGSLHPENLPFPQNYFVNSSSSIYYNASELNSPYYSYNIVKMGAYQNPATFRIFIARYYEMVKEIDDKLGQILKKLDDEGLTGNTMIVFCGDHGEMMGSHGMNSKNNFYDESARVPLIIRYPAKIQAGKRINIPVSNIDIRPTIDDYLNLPETKVDGKSLRPFIENTYDKNETFFAVSEWYNDKIPGFMVRTETHKLMIAHTAEATNTAIDGFYNLKTDSLEQINILKLSSIPQTEKTNMQALKVLLVKWLRKVNSPFYYSVKARPIGRLNANYSLYQNDVAKIKIPGVSSLTGLPAGMTWKLLTNDTIQINTVNINTGLFSATLVTKTGNSSVRFEMLPSIETTTSVHSSPMDGKPDFDIINENDRFTVKLNDGNLNDTKVQIFGVTGILMCEKSFTSDRIDFSYTGFTKGSYLVRVKKADQYFTRIIFVP